ncbi:MAG: fumarylacetoacetate hydrolase family protein [Steroidobacteraceae bacterium]|jgi:2-keto-4-pentenoate hydratase/2-oxohepta-3-ene-1,7-dioic acid hydratase in catechol pathway
MKLVTLKSGSPDGRLAVVSRDLRSAAPADDICPTLQAALDHWSEVAPALESRAAELARGRARGAISFDPRLAAAPLPRSYQWLDGSAFQSHGDLMAKVFHIENPQSDRPLMYQGMSHEFLSATEDVVLPLEADGIDFEGEFAVITDRVPMAIEARNALHHLKLIVQLNDWSLRTLAPIEMKTGFGWVQAKPACSVAPVAVTPDELGGAWERGRVALPLHVWWNGKKFGAANGAAMLFGFAELIAHAAHSRSLCAGTIIGSGTVSNENYREVGSSCIAERRAIELLDEGAAKTPYMRFGDTVRMAAIDAAGEMPFGAIAQKLVAPAR